MTGLDRMGGRGTGTSQERSSGARFANGALGDGRIAASVGDHVAETIHLAQHFIEAFGGALELGTITFALKSVHRLLDNVKQVKQLRDRPTQLGGVGSSWRRGKHA
jgi:hypothetical protein